MTDIQTSLFSRISEEAVYPKTYQIEECNMKHRTETAVPISDEEKAERRARFNYMRRFLRYEGTVLSPEIEALDERYINGELTADERDEAIRESVRKNRQRMSNQDNASDLTAKP